MGEVNIQLKDGSMKVVEQGTNVLEVIKEIHRGLAKEALMVEVDGVLENLSYNMNQDASLNILTFEDEKGREVFRHTSAHILANAVKNLYPEAKLGIGPNIENGFYYDFDYAPGFGEEDLKKISKEMEKIISANTEIQRFELSREEAIQYMTDREEPYKVELIHALPEDAVISFYKQGDFVDLCAGPHLASTKFIKAFKLQSVTGAYWKGDEKNPVLRRIYGTSFFKKVELEAYLEKLEEAKKRDHNKIGRELDLFTTVDVIGQGLPLLAPKGAKVLQILQRAVEDEEEKRGYLLTKTPLMAKKDLYQISGHWDHYRDGMFVIGNPEDDDAMALRPMTCPFQFYIYKSRLRSYKDLPLRYGETATLFRNESSGEMHGLIRVRQFTLAEGHIICRPDQLEEEFYQTLDLLAYFMKTLGLYEDLTYRFSKWDPNNTEKYINNPEAWESSQNQMRQMLDHAQIDYVEAEGEAAFYGPKLDIQIKNVYGKEDTLLTIQIDFALAEKYDMTYVDKDGQKKRPYIIHRSSIGCYERTLALLIEKYAGAFPTWLSPVQVKVLPIAEKYNEYCLNVVEKLKETGVRVEMDSRNEKIGYKIREAQMEKVPYMVIIGEKEVEKNQLSIRSRKEGELGSLTCETFLTKLLLEISTKAL